MSTISRPSRMMRQTARRILRTVIPHFLAVSIYAWKVLSWDYGHLRSVWYRMPLDRDGNPIPWFTYPAIDYLDQLDFSQKTVFEYGSGNSTLYWAKRSKKVISIENDAPWYNRLKGTLPTNVEYLLVEEKTAYANAIYQFNDLFDVIVIDGHHREECVQPSLDRKAQDALVILDNAERYPDLSQRLRDSGFIEIDMFGFGPISHYITCTSFFMSRNIDLKPQYVMQPRSPMKYIL